MKVYMFNPENGLYEGETFVAADMLEYEVGVTTIAPPAHEDGFVAVFDVYRQKWALMPMALARVQFLGRSGWEMKKPGSHRHKGTKKGVNKLKSVC